MAKQLREVEELATDISLYDTSTRLMKLLLKNIDPTNPLKELKLLQKLSHEELASIIHKSRTHITNTLRLLNLCSKAQEALVDKKISAGHAKVLVGLDEKDQVLMVNSIVGQKLSVREVENMIKSMKSKNQTSSLKNTVKTKNSQKLDFKELCEVLKKYDIKPQVSSNKITLSFENQEQIDKFIKTLK